MSGSGYGGRHPMTSEDTSKDPPSKDRLRSEASFLEDARLVVSFLEGDACAFDRIYRKHGPRLFAAASMMGAGRADAADIVHEVFVIAMVRLWQIENPAALAPWLFQVLRHEAHRRVRDRRSLMYLEDREREVADIAAPVDPHTDAALVIADEIASTLRSSLAGLADRDREILAALVRRQISGHSEMLLNDTPPETGSRSAARMMTSRMRDRLMASRSALLVARHGQDSCRVLRRMLRDWDGAYDPVIRKRIARHIETCQPCLETRRRFAIEPHSEEPR